MSDTLAIEYFHLRNYVAMFRRLNAVAMVVILETLDDLAARGIDTDAALWRSELGQVGIDAPRMKAAMAAVRSRRAGRRNWNSFQSSVQLTTLPQQERDEIRRFLVANSPSGVQTALQLSSLDDRFLEGFCLGLSSENPDSLATQVVSRIEADPIGFIDGYRRGSLRGLAAGLRSLATSLIDLFNLVITFSTPGVIYAGLAEGAALLTDAAHRELRRRQIAQARAIASAVNAALTDMVVRPADYVALSSEAGHMLGEHVGSLLTADLSSRTAPQLGDLTGRIVGQVAFEIILQLLLALATEGIGNAARAGVAVGEAGEGVAEATRVGLALGEATQGGSRLTQLAFRMRVLLERLPGVSRLLAALGHEREVQAMLRVDAEIARAVEAAFAEGAQFETGVIRVIRVSDPGITLTAEQLGHWRSLRGAGGLPEGFAQAWRACGNNAASNSLTEIRRLWAMGDDASKLEARRLARITFNNWRNRFMTRLRQPASAGLRAQIEGVGFRFGEGTASSPRLATGARDVLTLDHAERLMVAPVRCVDPANLEFVIGYENSVTLEQLRNFTSAELF